MSRGSKPGERRGGRKKGTPNRASAAVRAQAAASGLLPHEFLLAVCRGEEIDGHFPTFAERVDAAAKAAPYFSPRLAAVEATGRDGGPIEFAEMTTDQLRQGIVERMERLGFIPAAPARAH